jgi:glucose/arabinose dehydrogenase
VRTVHRRRNLIPGAPLIAVLLLAGCGSSHPRASSGGLIPIGAGINGPPGLRATVYARGLPAVAVFAFDSQGRLWAAAAGLRGHSHDGVYLIAHPGARPRRIVSGLDDPLGLLWHGARLYVSSLGRVSAYTGFTGSSFTRRSTIIRGPVRHGENNALVLAPDGRLAMGITATCDHCTPRSEWSGAIVSFRPDGSDLRLYAARIRAPVGLSFYPGTRDLFVTMNQRDDLGARTTGDALAVVAPGTDWRFPACYGQGGAACAGVPAPLAVFDPHAAVGPVAIVTAQLGTSVGNAALVGEWPTAKVARVALTRHGSTYSGSTSVWLTGLRHPLALAVAPGRAVLIGDWGTGTVYRIAPRTP